MVTDLQTENQQRTIKNIRATTHPPLLVSGTNRLLWMRATNPVRVVFPRTPQRVPRELTRW